MEAATALSWTPPSPATLAAFLGIVAAVILAFLAAVGHASSPERRARHVALAGAGVAGWMGLHALLGPHTLDHLPASLAAFMLLSNGTAVVLALSPLGRWLAQGVPLAALVAFPLYRLPLELVLHRWAEAGVIPVSMTWSGQNFDILSGILAPLCALGMVRWPQHRRPLAWVGSAVGFGLLLNVMRVALLSSPGPLRAFGDPPLVLVAHVPTVWILSICVVGALLGHLLAFRALLSPDPAP